MKTRRTAVDPPAPLEIKLLSPTRWLGRTIHHFQTIDSTNSRACQLALSGAGEGEIVIAESQEKGRGRMGRSWHSPPSSNLYLSVILRPRIPPRRASLLTLAAAVATAEAVREFSGLLPAIKWPNDILLGGRKVAGLLNEIRAGMDRVDFVILGLGVNLNTDRTSFPPEIRETATSLKEELGRAVSRNAFLQVLLPKLEAWVDLFIKEGAAPVLKAWRGWARLEGRPVRVTSLGETWTGLAVDIDADGSLMIRLEGGGLKRIMAGDVE